MSLDFDYTWCKYPPTSKIYAVHSANLHEGMLHYDMANRQFSSTTHHDIDKMYKSTPQPYQIPAAGNFISDAQIVLSAPGLNACQCLIIK